MKKRISIVVILLLTAIVLLIFLGIIIGGGIISGGLFNPRIDHERMERIFVDDYDLLIIVANYLTDSKHTSIHSFPERDTGFMSVFSNDLGSQQIPISDESVVNAIETLRERGYGIISRNYDVVRFLRWSMRGRGRGIAFTIDGYPPDESIWSFFTILEPLSKNGWFFYEEN